VKKDEIKYGLSLSDGARQESSMLSYDNLHEYQKKGVEHICDVPKSALFLEMGLGKTTTTLTAIDELMNDYFVTNKVLVIAPLRVANTVWHKEASKWEHLSHLKFSIITGKLNDRLTALQRTADVYVINRENVKWLVEHYKAKWPFDMVVIDESSSFKSHASQRFKALKKVVPYISRMVLLTGTPAANGYMDLWPQMYLLDGGLRLGRTITMFRTRYFDKNPYGFDYTIRSGSVTEIQNNIKDLVLSMQAEDYLELPKFVPTVLENPLEGPLLKQYEKFEKDLVLKLNGEDNITAMSAATLSNKLLQFCSGNMYDEDGKVHHIHDLKIDTLKEVIDENPNDNILVAYNYKHELEALKRAFPEACVLSKSGAEVEQWNKGEIKTLLAHPASAGHGLNLQHGGSLIIWYGFTWSLELYQQFNARLHRQGQTEVVRAMHIAVGEVEYKLMTALAKKDATQDKLIKALK
jgi:SNF2 family DNA or RNA helicase